jgi:hypothetical protein
MRTTRRQWSRLSLVLAICLSFSGVLPAVAEDEKVFQPLDLLDFGRAIRSYFDQDRCAEEDTPTWYGLEKELETMYADIMSNLKAFEDCSSVDVRYADDLSSRRLYSVAFRIVRVNEEPAIELDLNGISAHFQKSAVPVKFEVVFDGAYRFGIDEKSGGAGESTDGSDGGYVFFDFDHLSVDFDTSGRYKLSLGSDDFFPQGMPALPFSMGGLEFMAFARSLGVRAHSDYELRGSGERGLLADRDLWDGTYEVNITEKWSFSGDFELTRADAMGSLILEVRKEDLAMKEGALLRVEGSMEFHSLNLAGTLPLGDAVLVFSGEAGKARLEATALREDVARLMKDPANASAIRRAASAEVRVSGDYDSLTGDFVGYAEGIPLNIRKGR